MGMIPPGMTIESYIASLLPRLKDKDKEDNREKEQHSYSPTHSQESLSPFSQIREKIIELDRARKTATATATPDPVTYSTTSHMIKTGRTTHTVMPVTLAPVDRSLTPQPELPSYTPNNNNNDSSISISISNDTLPPASLVEGLERTLRSRTRVGMSGNDISLGLHMTDDAELVQRFYNNNNNSYNSIADEPIHALGDSTRARLPDMSQQSPDREGRCFTAVEGEMESLISILNSSLV